MSRIVFILALMGMTLIPLKLGTSTQPSTIECLAQAQTKQTLGYCLAPVISKHEHDFYLRRYDELLWKHEAY